MPGAATSPNCLARGAAKSRARLDGQPPKAHAWRANHIMAHVLGALESNSNILTTGNLETTGSQDAAHHQLRGGLSMHARGKRPPVPLVPLLPAQHEPTNQFKQYRTRRACSSLPLPSRPIAPHPTPPHPRLQVTRTQLEEWVNQPFFERDALNGCVVRMAYGPGVRDNTGATHPGYMVMQVGRWCMGRGGQLTFSRPRSEHCTCVVSATGT